MSGILTKTCERCDGIGTVEETRERRLDELSSDQITALVKSDVYRTKIENGGDEETQRELERQQQQAQHAHGSTPTMTRGP